MIHKGFREKPCIDLHSGGADLKFPHHDNEIAQSEGYYQNKQWVNYFLHNGALYIKGAKMSRSDKNYTIIKDILTEFPVNAIRMMMLLHKHDAVFNYDPETAWQEPIEKNAKYVGYFKRVKVYLRKGAALDNAQRFDEEEVNLVVLLEEKKTAIHQAFCNNFNTPDVIRDIDILVTAMNGYFKRDQTRVKSTLVKAYHDYIAEIFRVLVSFSEKFEFFRFLA